MSVSHFPVSEKKYLALLQRMEKLGVKEEDLEESFIRGSGSGGQKINKTSSCVTLVHRPTGVQVRCSRERSQSLNRYIARVLLLEKIERDVLHQETEAMRAVAKTRRQKARRSRKSKAKMLERKRQQSEKKSLRGPVRNE